MQQHLQLVTLGTSDVARSRRFYVDGLGLPVVLDVPGEITFLQAGHGLVLALWDREELAADAGLTDAPTSGAPTSSLAINLGSPDEVTAWVERARTAGATVTKEPQQAVFGGFHAYVTDPDGFLWEVAHNPGWSVDADGTVRLEEVTP